MNAFNCNVCSLGGMVSSLGAFSVNYNVNIGGRQVNAAEVFTEDFLSIRTASSVQSIAQYISDGSGTVGDDGSVTVKTGTSLFKVAPAGSVNVARLRQLLPVPQAVLQAAAIPINTTSTGARAAAVQQVLKTLPPLSPLPAGTTVKTPGITADTTQPSITQSIISTALSIFNTTQQTKQAQAAAQVATAAQTSPVFVPPTAPAQGAAVNTTAAYGVGGGTVRSVAPPPDPLNAPQLPALPPAPLIPTVTQPPVSQPLSPTTGVPVPFFPGIPATSETANGNIDVNAANLTRLIANSADANLPAQVPPPVPFYRQPLFLGLAVAALGAVLILNRRRRRR